VKKIRYRFLPIRYRKGFPTADGAKKKENVNRSQYVRVHVCLLARATRAVEGRKSKGDARSGRTGARTESKSVKIGLDDKVFLPRVFFHKATYAQSLQGDGSVHAAPLCEGPAQFAQFSTEKQRSTEKKKTREKTNFQKSQSEKEIRCTSTQQGNAWC